MSFMCSKTQLFQKVRQASRDYCDQMRNLWDGTKGLRQQQTERKTPFLLTRVSGNIYRSKQFCKIWRRWAKKIQTNKRPFILSETCETCTKASNSILLQKSHSYLEQKTRKRQTTKTRSYKCLWRKVRVLWRIAYRIYDHRPYSWRWCRASSQMRQGSQDICRHQKTGISKRQIPMSMPKLQYCIRFLWILSTSTTYQKYHKPHTKTSRAKAYRQIIRRLAESKGSPPIDYETVYCMRKV